jgi:hypothetical protein
LIDDAGMLAGVAVLVGVIACCGDWEGVGLTPTEGVDVACPLPWTGGSGVIWHAESSKHMQINATVNFR